MRTSRKIKALVGLGVGSSSLILLLIIASLLPTSVARVSSAQSAVVVVGKRQKIAGCALTQIGDGDAIPCSDAIPTSIDEEEIQFPTQITHSNIQQLAGTLHIPRGLPSPRPGVVLIHGSGPNSRDSTSTGGLIVKHEAYPVFGALAAQLAEQGLVVLRYDKRSCGTCYPNAKWDSAAFEFSDFEADARDAVRYLAGRAETDDHNIVVIGHSQGGRLAPFVATDNKHVAVVVMLSGTTQSFEQGLIGQTKRIEAYRLQQLDVFNTLSLWWVRRGWQACFDDLRDDYQPDE